MRLAAGPRSEMAPRAPRVGTTSRSAAERRSTGREELRRRQIGVETWLVAGGYVRRHRSDELAERRGTRVSGEQCPALQPRGKLGLQVEPEPECGVAKDVVDPPKLVDGTALLAPEQWMRIFGR